MEVVTFLKVSYCHLLSGSAVILVLVMQMFVIQGGPVSRLLRHEYHLLTLDFLNLLESGNSGSLLSTVEGCFRQL
jgi:hypothetical protein